MSYMKNLIKSMGNKTASKIADSDFCTIKNFYDTGVYIINGLLGGSFFKGLPSGVGAGFAGIYGCGKTYVLLKTASEFLKQTKKDGGIVFIFESEGAYDRDRVIALVGEDVADRLVVIQIKTIEQFKTQIFKLLNEIEKQGNTKPIFLGLDSLGMLATESDLENAEKGKNVRNMQKQQLIKSMFTIISGIIKSLDIPLFMTNHVYEKIGSYVPGNEISGGNGFKFACRNIVEMIKRKEKNDKSIHIGTGVTAISRKGLYVKEDFCKVKFAINFRGGIGRYSGLFDYILDNDIAKKINRGPKGMTLVFEDFGGYEITKEDRKIKTLGEIFHEEFLHYLDDDFQKRLCTGNIIEDAVDKEKLEDQE